MNKLIKLAYENEIRVTAGAYKVLDMLERRKGGREILDYIYPSIEANITHKRDINKILIGDLLISYFREDNKIIGIDNPGYFYHYLETAKPNSYNKQGLTNRDIDTCYDGTKGVDFFKIEIDTGFCYKQENIYNIYKNELTYKDYDWENPDLEVWNTGGDFLIEYTKLLTDEEVLEYLLDEIYKSPDDFDEYPSDVIKLILKFVEEKI